MEVEDDSDSNDTPLETITISGSTLPKGSQFFNVNTTKRVVSGVVNPNPGILKKSTVANMTPAEREKRTVSFRLHKKERKNVDKVRSKKTRRRMWNVILNAILLTVCGRGR
jgi:hypothetical protein